MFTPGWRPCGYKTASGRAKWPNRDLIEERGGLNPYGFIGNQPVDAVDLVGLVALHWLNQGPLWVPDRETFWMGFTFNVFQPQWRNQTITAMAYQDVYLEIEPCCDTEKKRCASSRQHFLRRLSTKATGAVIEGEVSGLVGNYDGGEFRFESGWTRGVASTTKRLFAAMGGNPNDVPPSRGTLVVSFAFKVVTPTRAGDNTGFTGPGTEQFLHAETYNQHRHWFSSYNAPPRWFEPGVNGLLQVHFEWDNCAGRSWNFHYGSTVDITPSQRGRRYGTEGAVYLLENPSNGH